MHFVLETKAKRENHTQWAAHGIHSLHCTCWKPKKELYNFVLTDLHTHARTCISVSSARTYRTKEICTACDTNFQCSWIHNITSFSQCVLGLAWVWVSVHIWMCAAVVVFLQIYLGEREAFLCTPNIQSTKNFQIKEWNETQETVRACVCERSTLNL